jgi:Tfp pilus assembly protein PilF
VHERHVDPTSPPTVASFASFVGTIAGIVVLIGALLAFDVFLSRVDLSESSRHAAGEYQRGVAFLAANEPSAAADHFASALAISRNNVDYALALGEAERRGGKAAAAETTLKTLLEHAENDGAVNLAMARVMVDERRVAEAKSYFHRAIYGHWGADSAARRAEARFALIDLLTAHGGGRDLLAELLPLEDVPADSVALRKRIGRWFLLAGSPARAANMFREVLHRDPHDGEAFAGMGEAALAQGNFRTARADFAQASELAPGEGAYSARLAFADSLMNADPTARGLDVLERESRAKTLLARMLTVLGPCVAHAPSPLVDSARSVLADTGAVKAPVLMADSLTSIAEQLWVTYSPACRASSSDSVIVLLAVRLSQ